MTRTLTVLQVASQLEGRGGIGRVVAGGARALAARGLDVHVAGPRADADLTAFGDLPLHVLPQRGLKASQLVDLVPLVRGLEPDVVHFHSAMPTRRSDRRWLRPCRGVRR